MGQTFAGWIEAERGRFGLWVPVAMAAAILVYFNLKSEPPFWLGFGLITAALAALAAGWRYPPARFVAFLALASAIGFARAEWRTAEQPPLIDVPYGVTALAGTVSRVDLLPQGSRITLFPVSLDGAPPSPRAVRVRLRNDEAVLPQAGDVVAVRAILFKQDRPSYPGGWDFGRDAFFQGLGASGFALGDVQSLTPPSRSWRLDSRLLNLRNDIEAHIMAVLPVPTGSFAVTLLTGLQQMMPAPERQAFVAAGLAHILAVAGLHVGIVMGLVFAAASFALSRFERVALQVPIKMAAAVAALASGGMYAALTGFHLPILRSLAMASLVTLGVLAGRRAISLRGLALAAIVVMLLTPEAVVGVSFQMSFSAVLALIAGYAAINLHAGAPTQMSQRLGRHAAALAYTSLLAGGASMPFAAYQFQQIQPYWILANLIAVPLTALWLMPLGLLALALMPFGLCAIALVPMGWGCAIIIWLTQVISTWPGAMLRIQPVPGAAVLLFALGLAWLCLWRNRPRLLGLALMAGGLLLYVSTPAPDVLVSPDAKLIAVRAGGQVYLLRSHKSSSYILTQWQPVWPSALWVPFTAQAAPPNVQCDDSSCVFAVARNKITVAFGALSGACPQAGLLVSPEPLRGACHGAGLAVIDRFSVWRDGAIAAWDTPRGFVLLSDRQVQGSRPWVTAWPDWYGGN